MFAVRTMRRAGTQRIARLCTSKIGSDGSHSDFAPKQKINAEENDVQAFLDSAIKSHDVILFMKGTPLAPKCGFSSKVVGILDSHSIDFNSADVLQSNDIREGIKQYSSWPTVPQLYVGGEFVGGCDIITEMEANGELGEVLLPFKEKQALEKAAKQK